jgi:hypothetical protein
VTIVTVPIKTVPIKTVPIKTVPIKTLPIVTSPGRARQQVCAIVTVAGSACWAVCVAAARALRATR